MIRLHGGGSETTTVTPNRAISEKSSRRCRYAFTSGHPAVLLAPGDRRPRRRRGAARVDDAAAAPLPDRYRNVTSSKVISSSERAFQLTLLLAP